MRYFVPFISVVMVAFPAMAQDTAISTLIEIDKADTVWLLISSALVMLMVPGIAFFYSGMVHSTNVVATIMHSFMKLCIVTVVWVLWGYTLAFGPSINGLFGDLSMAGLEGVGPEALSDSVRVPHYVFVLFQGIFAAITVAIITGAFAERVRLGPILIFSVIWITVVYAPIAHWIWGGGWITEHFEALDFAGGAVVHINAGVAGLVGALVLGRRVKTGRDHRPHNMPLTVIGASLLWFGWFGFNGGSALAADGIAALAVINTCLAAATAAIGWYLIESLYSKDTHVTALGIVSGALAGLVAITPAAGFVTPMAALVIGFVGGIACYYAVVLIKPKLGYDDSLDAFGLHGIGGIWGAIATGLFATTSVNAAGGDGLFYGSSDLLMAEIYTCAVVIAYSAIATFIILQVMRVFMRIRVTEEEEKKGLDAYQHGEVGYDLAD